MNNVKLKTALHFAYQANKHRRADLSCSSTDDSGITILWIFFQKFDE